ncbi:MAG TPA: glycosyltransferase family 4 protein [Methylomirabilota bacterium]|jgi:glycosyltransferase involved in cell wall biosynthesis|nr:glycosyltransferase family 4 protein [Methylomirabilota bacterium]
MTGLGTRQRPGAPAAALGGAHPPRPRVTLIVAGLEILGGHGVQASTLSARLREDGYDVAWLPVNPRFPRGLGWVRRVPYARTALNQALYLPSLRRLGEADVAHVFAASYWSFLVSPAPAIVMARRLGKRVVLNYHSGEAEDHLARWGPLVHPFLRMADAIVVPSVYLREVFARHGYRARVIPNVVDLSRFRYRDRMPAGPRLLSTRNLEPYYRVEDIVEAFALIRARHPEASLTIAGTGGQDAPLRRLAERLGTEGVRFVGRVEPEAMPGLYDESDIFLNASVVDNQPLSVLEAFAAGLPVVSTGAGDLSAMVRDGETGCVVPPRDPAAIAKAVMALLEDPSRALGLARRARRSVEAHTWAEVGEQWAAVYSGVER